MNFDYIIDQLSYGGIITLVAAFLATFVVMFIGGFIIRPMRRKIQSWTQKSALSWDNILFDLLNSTKKIVIGVWVFYLLAQSFNINDHYATFLKTLVVIATTIQVTLWALLFIREWRDEKLKRIAQQDASARAPIGLLSSVAEALVIMILALAALSNLGVNIGALIAGLGIGGVAVALAAQNILGDLFASFSILFDKPFSIGDYIVIGDYSGTVENIGLKTTRIKSATGEQLVISNKDLLESRIRNYKRMSDRRATQKIRLSYETPIKKLESVTTLVQDFFKDHSQARLEYCRFTEIGEYAFIFEIVFWVNDPNYNLYIEVQENFYLHLLRRLQEHDIELSEPRYTVNLKSPLPMTKAAQAHEYIDGHQ